MKREIRYYRPCMVLSGRKGKAVLEAIRNTPAPSHEQLRKEVEAAKREIMMLRANGE